MTRIAKVEVIYCDVDTCKHNDADTCLASPEIYIEKHTSAIPDDSGAIVKCKTYEEKP